MGKGCFITVEGIEGVGKSTNIELIESLLTLRGIDYITTREPGGTELAEEIRDILLDKNESSMVEMTELLLMYAARAQHVSELIKPALEKGEWVVCDRFADSSYAYQGRGRGVDLDLMQNLEKIALGDFDPDLTLLLDLQVEAGLERAVNRGELDRFEQEDVEFFNRVRLGFLERAKQHERFRVIDASRPLEEVQSEIRQLLMNWIDGWRS